LWIYCSSANKSPADYKQGGAKQTKAPRLYEAREVSYQQQTFFGHLKLHDKYLLDAMTCQIVAAVGAPKWGVFLVIICWR
jgi:hypothetical protein